MMAKSRYLVFFDTEQGTIQKDIKKIIMEEGECISWEQWRDEGTEAEGGKKTEYTNGSSTQSQARNEEEEGKGVPFKKEIEENDGGQADGDDRGGGVEKEWRSRETRGGEGPWEILVG